MHHAISSNQEIVACFNGATLAFTLTRVYYGLQCIKLPCRKSNLGNHSAQAKALLVVITCQTGIGVRE
ncbi:hypothetical protein TNCV_1422751 [Trichonephila clavipes]|nr:hypothetical protein TNCV_1422751 [Trichonephila clavipes]